ncbi:MAG: DoxX family protein [Muribaculaceae bacterium]|nr:DoxX family protein [Muribaculaceae bacterium]
MNKIEVLSVNPGTSTLGSLNPELASALACSSRAIGNRSDSLVDDTVDFFTAVRHPSAMRLGTALLMLRVAFGALLIVTGCFAIPSLYTLDSIAALQPYWEGVLQVAIGSLLCLGFGARIASLAGMAVFGTIATMAIMAGELPQTDILYTFGCFTFFILGAGRISVDGLIRKQAVIMRQRRKDPARLAKKRLSYQAFQYTSAH